MASRTLPRGVGIRQVVLLGAHAQDIMAEAHRLLRQSDLALVARHRLEGLSVGCSAFNQTRGVRMPALLFSGPAGESWRSGDMGHS